MGNVSLIVMEEGSVWPGQVGNCENVVVLGDDARGLLHTTRRGLDSLRRQGRCLRVAALACNEATDIASVARRAEVAHELWTAVSVVGFGRLLLSAPEAASMQLRCEVLSLADALSQGLTGVSATLSVRFGGAIDGRVEVPPRSEPPRRAEAMRHPPEAAAHLRKAASSLST
jgi:hypothetical protein